MQMWEHKNKNLGKVLQKESLSNWVLLLRAKRSIIDSQKSECMFEILGVRV